MHDGAGENSATTREEIRRDVEARLATACSHLDAQAFQDLVDSIVEKKLGFLALERDEALQGIIDEPPERPRGLAANLGAIPFAPRPSSIPRRELDR